MDRNTIEGRTTSRTVGPSRSTSGRAPARRVLVAVELFTGGSALLSGGLMVIRPDGSLLGPRAPALRGQPVHQLARAGVPARRVRGAGFLAAAALVHSRHRLGGRLSALAGVGLVVFEVAEWA